jgi:hypothetical protein
MGSCSAATQNVARCGTAGNAQSGRATLLHQRLEGRRLPAARALRPAHRAQQHQRIVQLIGASRDRAMPRCAPPRSRRVQAAELRRGLRIEPAPRRDRLRAPLLEWRIVQVGIGSRVQDFLRQRRGLRQIARHDGIVPALHARQQRHEAVDIHGLMQTVVQRLAHQRVIGHLALAAQILGARELIRKYHRNQILGRHALQGAGSSCPLASA